MRKLLSFSGRSDRFEWWWVSLVSDLLMQVSAIFGAIFLSSDEWARRSLGGLLVLGALLCLWLSLAVTVRRIRDRGRSPWCLLAGLIPVAGWIWLWIECGMLASPEERAPRCLVRRRVTAAGSEQAAVAHPVEREAGERESLGQQAEKIP